MNVRYVKIVRILSLAATVALGSAVSQGQSIKPTSNPASAPASASVPVLPTTDPAAMKILRQLESAGDKHATIEADIDYHVDFLQTGDSEDRTGSIAYQKETAAVPSRFRIHFDTLKQGDQPKIRDTIDYLFDGQWLTEAKHRIKQMKRYQVAAPGEKIQPLKLGKGPFPLPFGQKADEVIRYFEVTTRPPEAADPKGTDYLKLTTRPKEAASLSFTRMELWVDAATGLPVKIISQDRNKNINTVLFRNIKSNEKVDPGIFNLDRPDGWEYHVEPLKQ